MTKFGYFGIIDMGIEFYGFIKVDLGWEKNKLDRFGESRVEFLRE